MKVFITAMSKFAKISRYVNINFFSTSSTLKSSYDNDGKTTVNMLNQEAGLGIMINTLSQAGFRLNNGVFVVGPMIVFPKTALSWNIDGDQDISEKSLVLFSLLQPKLDILVIGYGNNTIDRPRFDNIVMKLRSRRRNMNIEVLPTENAVTTFNFLVAEGRFVGAALVPPFKLNFDDNDYALSKVKRRQLYSKDN